MGRFGNQRRYSNPFDIEHWECSCGQPNAFDRKKCLACDKIPDKKVSMSRGGRPQLDADYGIIGNRS